MVLPLPGYDIMLPRNQGVRRGPVCMGQLLTVISSSYTATPSFGEEYHKLLAQDGLTLEMMRHKVK